MAGLSMVALEETSGFAGQLPAFWTAKRQDRAEGRLFSRRGNISAVATLPLEFVQEEDMTTRLALLSLALVGIAGLAHAQSMGTAYPTQSGQYESQQAMGVGGCGHQSAITDEYGFRYDGQGNRLNARGCVIAPPVTLPGARAIQNR
jgi:hypothetical protein